MSKANKDKYVSIQSVQSEAKVVFTAIRGQSNLLVYDAYHYHMWIWSHACLLMATMVTIILSDEEKIMIPLL